MRLSLFSAAAIFAIGAVSGELVPNCCELEERGTLRKGPPYVYGNSYRRSTFRTECAPCLPGSCVAYYGPSSWRGWWCLDQAYFYREKVQKEGSGYVEGCIKQENTGCEYEVEYSTAAKSSGTTATTATGGRTDTTKKSEEPKTGGGPDADATGGSESGGNTRIGPVETGSSKGLSVEAIVGIVSAVLASLITVVVGYCQVRYGTTGGNRA